MKLMNKPQAFRRLGMLNRLPFMDTRLNAIVHSTFFHIISHVLLYELETPLIFTIKTVRNGHKSDV